MSNDLIKRADVKESLLGWETDPTDEEIEYTIDGIPAVDAVEVVHAVWNHLDTNPKYHTHIVECSECGAIFNVSIFDWGLNYNYCPNCGARMDD